jgi:hypothetical protein
VTTAGTGRTNSSSCNWKAFVSGRFSAVAILIKMKREKYTVWVKRDAEENRADEDNKW